MASPLKTRRNPHLYQLEDPDADYFLSLFDALVNDLKKRKKNHGWKDVNDDPLTVNASLVARIQNVEIRPQFPCPRICLHKNTGLIHPTEKDVLMSGNSIPFTSTDVYFDLSRGNLPRYGPPRIHCRIMVVRIRLSQHSLLVQPTKVIY